MTHYIDKDALVAKIKRRFDECSSSILKNYDACKEAKALELGKTLTIIDTLEVIEIGVDLGDPKGDKNAKYIIDTKNLEVREVDLEKEINKYICDNFFGSQTMGFFANRTKEEPNDQDIALCAKHFFELGFSVNNPITAADRGTAEEIIINLKRVEQDYLIDLTKEMEWIRNQAQKGE